MLRVLLYVVIFKLCFGLYTEVCFEKHMEYMPVQLKQG